MLRSPTCGSLANLISKRPWLSDSTKEWTELLNEGFPYNWKIYGILDSIAKLLSSVIPVKIFPSLSKDNTLMLSPRVVFRAMSSILVLSLKLNPSISCYPVI
jgi:hypothetical protein